MTDIAVAPYVARNACPIIVAGFSCRLAREEARPGMAEAEETATMVSEMTEP